MVRLLLAFLAASVASLCSTPTSSATDVPWRSVFNGTYGDLLGAAPFSDEEPTVVATSRYEAAWRQLRPWFAGIPQTARDRMVAVLDGVDFRTHALIAVAARGSCLDEIRVTRIKREAAIISVFAERYDTTAPQRPGQPPFACLAISFFNFDIVAVPWWVVGDSPYTIVVIRNSAPGTVEMGRGLGGWRLGMTYRTHPGLLTSQPYPQNRRSGCFGYLESATRVDRYPGLRLAWTNGALTNVATTTRGHRSETGFQIGTASFDEVRKRFPTANVARHRLSPDASGRNFALGSSTILVTRNKGSESWVSTRYWFDRQGVLVALETLNGGC